MINNFIWIDDYPSPIREEAHHLLEEKFNINIIRCFLHENGFHEGRTWNIDSGKNIGFWKICRIIDESVDKNVVIILELSMPLIWLYLYNFLKLKKIKVIIITGHLNSDKINFKNILRKLYTLSSNYVANSFVYYSTNSFTYNNFNNKNSFTIGYGTPLQLRSPLIKKLSEKNKIEILLIGLWSNRKNFHLIADSLSNRLINGKSFNISHIGYAPESIKSRFPNIKFFGHISKCDQIDQFRLSSDISFLISDREPWGHVVLENINCGLLTFTSANCGSNDLINNISNNFVLNRVNKSSIIKAIEWYTSLSTQSINDYRNIGYKLLPNYTPMNFANAIYKSSLLLNL